jgi:hypothetical protein
MIENSQFLLVSFSNVDADTRVADANKAPASNETRKVGLELIVSIEISSLYAIKHKPAIRLIIIVYDKGKVSVLLSLLTIHKNNLSDILDIEDDEDDDGNDILVSYIDIAVVTILIIFLTRT